MPFNDKEETGAEIDCVLFEMIIKHLHGNITWIDQVGVQVDTLNVM